MLEKLRELQRKPWIAHLLRATARFGSRLGSQFAAAITYFSVLSLVPILSFAFATAGFIVSRDAGLQQTIRQQITTALNGAPMANELGQTVLTAFDNWVGVGIFAVLAGAYSGAGWIGNIKSAIRAQMRPTFDVSEQKRNIVVEVLVNLAILVVFLLTLAVTFGLSGVATALGSTLIGALNLGEVPGIRLLFRFVPLAASLIAGFVLFAFVFRVFPEYRPPRSSVIRASIIGAVALAVLQYSLGFLIARLFSGNPTLVLFGPVIALMFFLNLFAQLILWLACWIATKNQFAIAGEPQPADEPLERSDIEVLTPERFTELTGAGKSDEKDREPAAAARAEKTRWQPPSYPKPIDFDGEPGERDDLVPQQVAARGVRAGMAGGWLVGLASGLGAGALVTAVLNKLRR